MTKLADFLWNEGAQVPWVINLGWALAAGSEQVLDPLESFLEEVEPDKFREVFDINGEIDDDSSFNACDILADRLLMFRKEGFLAEVAIADRENWTESGWSEVGARFIRYVYAEDLPSLEAKIFEAVQQQIERIRSKKFTPSSVKAEGSSS